MLDSCASEGDGRGTKYKDKLHRAGGNLVDLNPSSDLSAHQNMIKNEVFEEEIGHQSITAISGPIYSNEISADTMDEKKVDSTVTNAIDELIVALEPMFQYTFTKICNIHHSDSDLRNKKIKKIPEPASQQHRVHGNPTSK